MHARIREVQAAPREKTVRAAKSSKTSCSQLEKRILSLVAKRADRHAVWPLVDQLVSQSVEQKRPKLDGCFSPEFLSKANKHVCARLYCSVQAHLDELYQMWIRDGMTAKDESLV